MVKRILILACILAALLYLAYRPGGFKNRHDWVTEHFRGPVPCPPKSIEPVDPNTFTFSYCGSNSITSLMDINISAGATKENRAINVRLDYCLKHGEWRTLGK